MPDDYVPAYRPKSLVSETIDYLMEDKSTSKSNKADSHSGETKIRTKTGDVWTNDPSLFGKDSKPVKHRAVRYKAHG